MKRLLQAAVAMVSIVSTGAGATDLSAMQALRKDFRTGASVLIYFTAEQDGYHMVVTVQSDDTEPMTIFRFTAILAIGQTAEISVPHRPGEMPEALLISRAGEKLVVSEPFAVASASR